MCRCRFQVRWASVSQRGYYPDALYKGNQDSVTTCSSFGNDPEQLFFGIFDGHGSNGAQCSQFAREHVSRTGRMLCFLPEGSS